MTASDIRLELEAANLEAARAAVGRVPLHAASIETRAGVIAFAGVSGAGKSTLAAACVLAGYGYVADEITAVSPDDLSVTPFHRPIGLRRRGAAAIGLEYPDPSDGRYDVVYPWQIDAGHHRSPGGTLAGIVLVRWAEGAVPELSEVASAVAMVELSQHLVIPDERLSSSFADLDRLVRSVPVVRMTYGTTEQSLQLVAQVIERLSP